MEDLTSKPFMHSCPFCGNFEHLEVVGAYSIARTVQCKVCGSRGPISLCDEGAIRMWNKQAALVKDEPF